MKRSSDETQPCGDEEAISDGSPARRKRLVLLASILASSVVALDTTAVSVALPAIASRLGVGLAVQQWIINSYLLTLGPLLLLGGSLGDRYRLQRVFLVGLAGFEAASLACALAPGIVTLIAARVMQGASGALLVPSTLAVITATYDEDEQSRAFARWTAWSSLALIVGPLLGGAIVEALSWRWVFALHVVPGAAAILAVRALEGSVSAPQPEKRIDWTGATLCTLGLAGPVLALIQQPTLGWSHPIVWGGLAVGALLVGAFLAWERRTQDPMLPLGLFRRRNFAACNLATLFIYAGMNAFAVFTILYLQQVAGYSALLSALALTPTMAMVLLLPQPLSRLSERFGPRLIMSAGAGVAGGGLLLLLRVDAGAGYVGGFLPALLLFGLGMAALAAPLTATVLGAVREEYGGLASGVNNAVSRVAGLLAIAAVGAVIAGQFAGALDRKLDSATLSAEARRVVSEAKEQSLSGDASGVPAGERERVGAALGEASASAYRWGMGVSAALLACGSIVVVVGVRDPRPE